MFHSEDRNLDIVWKIVYSFCKQISGMAAGGFMNVIELMDAKTTSFSKTDRKIYESIRKFPEEYAAHSITKISEMSGFTKPALTRFAQRLGYSGFIEFQFQFQQALKDQNERQENVSNAAVYARLIGQVDQLVNRSVLQNLVKRIRESRCVYLHGANLSRIPAEELNMALQYEPEVLCMLPQQDVPRLHYQEKDLVIVYSAMGNNYQRLIKSLREEGTARPYMVLITTNSKNALRHHFDEVIVLPSTKIGDPGTPVLSDTFAFLMFNDLIVQELKNIHDNRKAGEQHGSTVR